ncbi:hypothetical protein POSPLADRAFT_1060837 [Postia placenta MAD-698-R-SB12]|uniref:Transaldolase n=1 Tax=Postia placenta MAD-698-R-SB12 TaxID=670580 RepID=A0A1X6MQ62_9APHY|nr:hypothetical protein POSPLADRAFT_1060837 [Postia placenta MAD-698-R-SB12]OSX58346.1 hypothetical protein POSPLADRAFT_1060837 [Postia placenta MAD-698-R-SB12]
MDSDEHPVYHERRLSTTDVSSLGNTLLQASISARGSAQGEDQCHNVPARNTAGFRPPTEASTQEDSWPMGPPQEIPAQRHPAVPPRSPTPFGPPPEEATASSHRAATPMPPSPIPGRRRRARPPPMPEPPIKCPNWMAVSDFQGRRGDTDKAPPTPRAPAGRSDPKRGRGLLQAMKEADIKVIARTTDLTHDKVGAYQATMIDPWLLDQEVLKDSTAFLARVAVEDTLHNKQPRIQDVGDPEDIVDEVLMRYRVYMGLTLMDDVPGPHFTFVDPLLAINAGGMARQAMKLVRLFEAAANGERAKVEDQVISNEDVEDQKQEINCGDADSQGAGRQRLKRKDIIVCIPANTEGIKAARWLETQDIKTNLIFVSSLEHASLCIEAGATFITFNLKMLAKCEMEWAYAKSGSTQIAEIVDAQCRAAALDTIRIVAAYCHYNKVKTEVLVANTRLCDIQWLGDVKGVVLHDYQTQDAISENGWIRETSPAVCAVARAAKYPTTYVGQKGVKERYVKALPPRPQWLAGRMLFLGLDDIMKSFRELTDHMQALLENGLLKGLSVEELQQMYFPDITNQKAYEAQLEQAENEGHPTYVRNPGARTNHLGYRLYDINWDKPEKPVEQDGRLEADNELMSLSSE